MSGSDNFTQIRKAFPKWGGEADIAVQITLPPFFITAGISKVLRPT